MARWAEIADSLVTEKLQFAGVQVELWEVDVKSGCEEKKKELFACKATIKPF